MRNQDISEDNIIHSTNSHQAHYRLPFELFNDQFRQTVYEISRMPNIDGYLLGGEVSLASALVRRCGYSLRTARRHIRRLEQSGLIIRAQKPTLTGLQGTHLYRRLFD
ncbi:helix-turn-helix domain-containing protein [Shewanella putrefaciens]|uniref:helix-turn-helix domain-containing protein n=1 Tax=Shewanella putrefaciens TaxID=24 RepID=UPI0021C04F7E|nr:helix-turn-helix domain-containing protein [Shewanella putrefaciens]UXK06952.1 helix-turn-helix domain-containing protein [Shewanella putrefaciens]